ncbi:hypothetical protein, partial [Pseudorhodoferax sp. Leaf265]|uniref:hypothetical protein n=1 Tax=Pseudorhodoferax sp. Leaf265 TaxID=1736315 RepID=UPI001F29C57C
AFASGVQAAAGHRSRPGALLRIGRDREYGGNITSSRLRAIASKRWEGVSTKLPRRNLKPNTSRRHLAHSQVTIAARRYSQQ